jgi:hypothetical protein
LTPMTGRDTPFGLAVIYDISQLNVFVVAWTVAARSAVQNKANISADEPADGRE